VSASDPVHADLWRLKDSSPAPWGLLLCNRHTLWRSYMHRAEINLDRKASYEVSRIAIISTPKHGMGISFGSKTQEHI